MELANASSASAGKLTPGVKGIQAAKAIKDVTEAVKASGPDKTMAEQLASLPELVAVLLASLEDYLLSLGAYFSDRGRPFQSDRGRRNGVIGEALGKRASTGRECISIVHDQPEARCREAS